MAKAHIKKVFENEDIIRSENDKRLHRGLELSNGMKVMLVSDKDTDKSAAAMDINIGVCHYQFVERVGKKERERERERERESLNLFYFDDGSFRPWPNLPNGPH